MSSTTHPAYPTSRQLQREARAEAIVASHEEAMRNLAAILDATSLEISALDLRIGPRGYGRQDVLDTLADLASAARADRAPDDLELLALDMVEDEEGV